MAYSLPRDVYSLLESAMNHDHEKAEIVAKSIETSIQIIEDKADEKIIAKKDTIKAELYNELRNELASKEFVRAEILTVKEELRAEIQAVKEELKGEINGLRGEINGLRIEINQVRSEIKQIALLIKFLMGIAIFALTLFNPAFVKLVELVIK